MSPGPPKRFTSESSSSVTSENDSLLSTSSSSSSSSPSPSAATSASASSGSEAATPLGTPTTHRAATGTPTTNRSNTAAKAAVFNQAELIAKYGEEIFSRSSPAPPEKKDGGAAGGAVGKVGALCSQLESKAKIRA